MNLTLNFIPKSTTQYPTVYRFESPGFALDNFHIGNFNKLSTQQHQFKAGTLETSRISVVFYNGNYEAGRVDFEFEKSDGGQYEMAG